MIPLQVASFKLQGFLVRTFAACNLQPGTWNLQPGTWNLEPGTCK
jgi:hypothetical protein